MNAVSNFPFQGRAQHIGQDLCQAGIRSGPCSIPIMYTTFSHATGLPDSRTAPLVPPPAKDRRLPLGVERYGLYDWNSGSAERRYTGGPGQKGAMTSGDGRAQYMDGMTGTQEEVRDLKKLRLDPIRNTPAKFRLLVAHFLKPGAMARSGYPKPWPERCVT